MANKENMTKGMSQTQNAIEFINKSVLKPDVTPMKGTASPMIQQATGMMVQDLQSFLKGFEQVGLVALARLANNLLTYGEYYGPKPSGDDALTTDANSDTVRATKTPNINAEHTGSDVMKGLFSAVGEYGKMKAEISSIIHNNHIKGDPVEDVPHQNVTATQQTHTNSDTTQHPKSDAVTQPQTSTSSVSTNKVEPLHTKNDITPKPPTNVEDATTTSPKIKEVPKETESNHATNAIIPAEKENTTKVEPNNATEAFTNSLKDVDEIFEPLIETTEKLSDEMIEAENQLEEMMDEDANNFDTNTDDDNDDDDTASNQKTYWFPKKK